MTAALFKEPMTNTNKEVALITWNNNSLIWRDLIRLCAYATWP